MYVCVWKAGKEHRGSCLIALQFSTGDNLTLNLELSWCWQAAQRCSFLSLLFSSPLVAFRQVQLFNLNAEDMNSGSQAPKRNTLTR